MIDFAEWKAMWDKSGPWPVITHADAHLLLTEIARAEGDRDAALSLLRELVAQLNVALVMPENKPSRLEDAQGNFVLLSPEAEEWLLATSTETTT